MTLRLPGKCAALYNQRHSNEETDRIYVCQQQFTNDCPAQNRDAGVHILSRLLESELLPDLLTGPCRDRRPQSWVAPALRSGCQKWMRRRGRYW